jgi:hypothetical protein
VVPNSENSAWYWAIGSTCPLHSIQPEGANAKLNALISPTNGLVIATISLSDALLVAGIPPPPGTMDQGRDG